MRHPLLDANARYRANGRAGVGAPGETCHLSGRGVLFTAPHAVCQTRRAQPKPADALTGPVAEQLARLTGAGALTLTGAVGDANFDAEHPFKTVLAELAGRYTLIVDVHGMSDAHDVDICVGLGPQPGDLESRFTDTLAARARQAGLPVSVNWPFDATFPGTVTAFAQRHGHPAVQVELARRLRRPGRDPLLSRLALDTLAQAALTVR